jgi:hypothetical protein
LPSFACNFTFPCLSFSTHFVFFGPVCLSFYGPIPCFFRTLACIFGTLFHYTPFMSVVFALFCLSPPPLPVFFHPLACIFCTLFHPYTTHFCLSFLHLLAFLCEFLHSLACLFQSLACFFLPHACLFTPFSYSDDSDDPSGDPRHLPSRILLSKGTTRKRKRGALGNKKKRMENDEEEEQANGGGPAPPGPWKKRDPGLVGSNIPPFLKPVRSAEDQVF